MDFIACMLHLLSTLHGRPEEVGRGLLCLVQLPWSCIQSLGLSTQPTRGCIAARVHTIVGAFLHAVLVLVAGRAAAALARLHQCLLQLILLGA